MVFKTSQRSRKANSPYASHGEMAASDCVSALDRADSPLFPRFLVSYCHFSRQIRLLYEFMTLFPAPLKLLF